MGASKIFLRVMKGKYKEIIYLIAAVSLSTKNHCGFLLVLVVYMRKDVNEAPIYVWLFLKFHILLVLLALATGVSIIQIFLTFPNLCKKMFGSCNPIKFLFWSIEEFPHSFIWIVIQDLFCYVFKFALSFNHIFRFT